MMVPASNQKLLTVAAAARRLGWDFRYTTRVLATGAVKADGTLDGDLVVVGSGDPTINPRHPDRWGALDGWAGQVAARGVKVINGHLIGDDNAFAEPGLGSGWSWDDLVTGYGSPIGALQYNENEVELLVGPGMTAGAAGIVSMSPMGSGLLVDNQVVTVAADQPTRVISERMPGWSMLTVRGQVAGRRQTALGPGGGREPDGMFLNAFREALSRKGIFIGGSALDIDDAADGAGHVEGGDVGDGSVAAALRDRRSAAQAEPQRLRGDAAVDDVASGRAGQRSAGLQVLQDTLTDARRGPGALCLVRRLGPVPLRHGDGRSR